MDAGHVAGVVTTVVGLVYIVYTKWQDAKKKEATDNLDVEANRQKIDQKKAVDSQEVKQLQDNYFDERAKRQFDRMDRQMDRVLKEHRDDRLELDRLKGYTVQLTTENALLKKEKDQLQEDNTWLRKRVEELEGHLGSKGGGS